MTEKQTTVAPCRLEQFVLRVLIGCEFSGIVRDAFTERGHNAWSCDLLPSEAPGQHYQGDIRDMLDEPWDLAIFHPPCTHLAVSGARHFKEKIKDGRQQDGIKLFLAVANAPISKIAIENPVGIMSKIYRKPDQIIHPYFFGTPERKATCLWLKGLPKLQYFLHDDLFDKATAVVPELITTPAGDKLSKWHYDSYKLPDSEKGKFRSRTFPSLAKAMALQWG